MGNLLKESYIYHLLECFFKWIKRLFTNSLLIGKFLTENNIKDTEEKTIFAIVIRKIIIFFQKIMCKHRINQVLEDSIFVTPIIWLSITVFLAPFLPTMMVLLLLILVAISFFLKMLITPNIKLRIFPSNHLVLIFILIVGITSITSISVDESKKIALLVSAFTLSYFLVINIIENEKQLKWILYVFITASSITAILGIYQYVGGNLYTNDWVDTDMFEDISMRVYSTFENPNVYGEYLILAIPMIVGLFFEEKETIKKVALFLCFAVNMIALVLTFSRGCWIAIILSLGILLLIVDRRFMWIELACVLILPFVLPEVVINRLLSIGNMDDSSTSYRVYIWQGTIDMLKDYWFSGVGLGKTSFNTVYPNYSYNGVWTQHAHNLYLQLLVEYGAIGFLIVLSIVYQFYKKVIISMHKRKNLVTAGLMSSITAYLIQSMFDNTWYNYRVLLLFWIVIALGVVSTDLKKEDK